MDEPSLYYHVTHVANLESILRDGLLSHAPKKNFRCKPRVFFSQTREQALGWANEIARTADGVNVDNPRATLVIIPIRATLQCVIDHPATWTTVGITEYSTTEDIPASAIDAQNLEYIQVVPLKSHYEYIDEWEEDKAWFCVECEKVMGSEKAMEAHVALKMGLDSWRLLR